MGSDGLFPEHYSLLSLCISDMLRTVRPVDLTRGECVAADPREFSVALGAIWTQDMFRMNEL